MKTNMVCQQNKLGLYRRMMLPAIIMVLGVCFASFTTSNPALAYEASITTTGTVSIDVLPTGERASIGVDEVTVESTCPLGYTLSIAGPDDSTLYKDGDSSNDNTNQTIAASSGTEFDPVTILGNNIGTWGYSAEGDTDIYSGFIGLTGTPAVLVESTEASYGGGDSYPIYYGVSVGLDKEAGLYTLAESSTGAGDNVITYYLITSPDCDDYIIRYDDNGANSDTTMGDQVVSPSDSEIDLWPSNFQWSGYGFAGWSLEPVDPDDSDINSTLANLRDYGRVFGPMETIEITDDLLEYLVVDNDERVIPLYAVWVPSADDLQGWNGCYYMNEGDVTALTDTRDNNTYAVAKLADGQCWMIENLRLDHTNSDNTTGTLSQGYGGQFAGLALPETANFYASYNPTDPTEANSLYYAGTGNQGSLGATIDITQTNYAGYRMPRYRNDNTNTDTTTNPNTTVANMTGTDQNIYSYGNYYTWAAAKANTSYLNDATNSNAATTSICPSGWQLPTGTGSGDFGVLSNNLGGYKDANDVAQYMSSSTTPTGAEMSKVVRSYPNNFVYSGEVSGSSVYNRGSLGRYWSATASVSRAAYNFGFYSTNVNPGEGSASMNIGWAIRCVAAEPYTIHFDANGGTGTMNNQTAYVGSNITLRSNTFTRSGYAFGGWNTEADGTGTSYADGATVVDIPATDGVATLYAQWICPPNTVCYSPNANLTLIGPSRMGNQSFSATATTIDLWPSNFQRINYGFAGWNTKADGTGTTYGPMETINITAGQYNTAGLQLYAKWVIATGSMQWWNGCSSMAQGEVTALNDMRDNNTYAVAKLADGKCWMIENLRLDNTNSDNAYGDLAQDYGGQFAGLALPETANFAGSLSSDTEPTEANSLYYAGTGNEGSLGATINILQENYPGSRMPRYRNDNTNTDSATNPNTTVANMTSTSQNIYSYGNYYSWPAALANTNYYDSPTATDSNGKTSETANTSLCPSGWRLPTGTGSGDFGVLSNNLGGYKDASDVAQNMSSSTTPTGADMSKTMRSYPNNFVYSGSASVSSVNNRGSSGIYWSATVSTSNSAFGFTFLSTYVAPGTSSNVKYGGRTIRCVVSP